jgi:hypothetical protein
VRSNQGIVADWYAVDWRPNPNWSGHAVLAVLMTVVPPVIAEKILVSGIVLLFLCGIWLFAGAVGESGRAVAFFAFPFAYNLPLQMGFYNFCIGAALYFVTGRLVGHATARMRGRSQPSPLCCCSAISRVVPAIAAGDQAAGTARARPARGRMRATSSRCCRSVRSWSGSRTQGSPRAGTVGIAATTAPSCGCGSS